MEEVLTNDCQILLVAAQVLLHGGQIVSWKNERREELLFMTNKVKFSDYLYISFIIDMVVGMNCITSLNG